jgi:hypothetical protein
MELIHPIELWRELVVLAIFAAVFVPCVIYLCRHIHFQNAGNEYAFGSALLFIGVVVLARLIWAPIVGMGFGLMFLVALAHFFPDISERTGRRPSHP